MSEQKDKAGVFGEPWRWSPGWSEVTRLDYQTLVDDGVKYAELQLLDRESNEIIPLRIDHYEAEWDTDGDDVQPSNRIRERIVACVNACANIDDPQQLRAQLDQAKKEAADYMDGIANCLSAVGIDMSDVDAAEAECCRLGKKPSDVVRAKYEQLRAQRDEMLEALVDAEDKLEYASRVFNDRNFTDRHGMGPEFRKSLGKVRTAIANATPEPASKITVPQVDEHDPYDPERWGGPDPQEEGNR